MYSGELGSGAGKGGGGGGSIREAGGAFGKIEAAREEEYFYRKVHIYYLGCPWLHRCEVIFTSTTSYIRT